MSKDLFLEAKDLLQLPDIDNEIKHKLKVIINYENNTISEVAKMFNVSATTVSRWVVLFKKEGVEGLKVKK